ncbi:hypothetical protein AB0E83_12430 [Streptomyces sp. NPDC035033]|uniref:hypothetical protein n=1 Tax=Streptomyces sp. NPDC035033 TaxID=3155368 RepID=UPI00340A29CF
MVDTRIADLRLVPDRPGRLPLARVMDSHRTGPHGHFAGGTAAVHAARDDRRAGAVANLEGHPDPHPAPAGPDLMTLPEIGLLLLGVTPDLLDGSPHPQAH